MNVLLLFGNTKLWHQSEKVKCWSCFACLLFLHFCSLLYHIIWSKICCSFSVSVKLMYAIRSAQCMLFWLIHSHRIFHHTSRLWLGMLLTILQILFRKKKDKEKKLNCECCFDMGVALQNLCLWCNYNYMWSKYCKFPRWYGFGIGLYRFNSHSTLTFFLLYRYLFSI